MKNLLAIFFVCLAFTAKAQKIEAIYFNLYTDSLKIGVHNYINVDGKLSDGKFLPLTSEEIKFSSCVGKWEGNSLILDSCFREDSVIVTAMLKQNPSISKTITIYLKKDLNEGQLKTEKELLDDWRKKKKS